MSRFTPKLKIFFVHAINEYSVNPKTAVGGTLLFLAAVVALFIFLSIPEHAQENIERIPTVAVASVRALSMETEPITVLGEVRSISQVELRAQKPGKITNVYVTAGQFVAAGTVLAEIENAAERAAVLSAQGTLAAAEAQLQKTLAGARTEDKASTVVQAESALVTLRATEDSARSAFSQAYTLAQNAILAQADDFFTNEQTVNPSFRVRTASYDERQVFEHERVELGAKLTEWKQSTTRDIPAELLDSHLAIATEYLETMKSFLNRISVFVSEQEVGEAITSAEKEADEATILSARTNIDNARAAINSARSTLASARSAAQVAQLNETKNIVGARSEDISSAEAVVTQARGALAGTVAALENTRIRTPISGTVNVFNINAGDFVTSFEPIAVVVSEGAFVVEAFVSDTVRERILPGDAVQVEGNYDGVVTSISPGLDPATKKAKVTIGLAQEAPLAIGSFVEVEVYAADTAEEMEPLELMVPITAIKVLPRTMAVFTVTEENTLAVVPIQEGPIVGNNMLVPEGLTSELEIVIDVRGLKEGDTVLVDE